MNNVKYVGFVLVLTGEQQRFKNNSSSSWWFNEISGKTIGSGSCVVGCSSAGGCGCGDAFAPKSSNQQSSSRSRLQVITTIFLYV